MSSEGIGAIRVSVQGRWEGKEGVEEVQGIV